MSSSAPRYSPLLPFGAPPPGLSVATAIARVGNDRLVACWRVAPPSALPLAPRGRGIWREGLWEHTCFELFVAAGPGAGYVEYNVAPCGDWAAFGFDGYRSGRKPFRDLPPPTVSVARAETAIEITAHLPLPAAAIGLIDSGTKCAMAAVLEDVAGTLSYWALAHPRGQPDFHDPRSFIAVLTDGRP